MRAVNSPRYIFRGPGKPATLQIQKRKLGGRCRTRRKRHFTAMHNAHPKSSLLFFENVLTITSFYEKPPTAVVAGKKTKALDDDDTPKSFLRLTKRKSRKELIAQGKIVPRKEKTITIQPGESFSDFRRRVDKEIPVRMGSMGKEGKAKKKKKKPKAVVEDEDDEDDEEAKKKRYGSVCSRGD